MPDTSYEQNPAGVRFNDPGLFDVTLTVTNCGGSDTEVKVGYILVNPGTLPVADFEADVTNITIGDTVYYTDLSSGDPNKWTWTFEGGSPGSSNSHSPPGIVYNEEGTYNTSLWIKNAFGNNTMLKEGYITVGFVSVPEINQNGGILVFPNPSDGMVTLKVVDKRLEIHNILIFNANGHKVDEIPVGQHVDRVVLDLSNQPDGLYHLSISTNNKVINKKVSLVK